MIAKDTMFNIKNRSTSIVVYTIPELGGLRRSWQPGRYSPRSSYRWEHAPGRSRHSQNRTQRRSQHPEGRTGSASHRWRLCHYAFAAARGSFSYP